MSRIEENLAFLREGISQALVQSNRRDDDIVLVAVSKMVSIDDINQAYQCGIRIFGESRIQDAIPKMEVMNQSDVLWHFIGHLQTNKVNKAVDHFAMIHSVDSLELARRIDQQAALSGCKPAVLLEVNTSHEDSKYGYTRDQLWRDLPELVSLTRIVFQGLMTVAEYSENEKTVRDCFGSLRSLAEELSSYQTENFKMIHLSMGMSHDYPWAISEGSTMLRIGSAIFGARI